jgi:transcriptional regulator with PAS, ATPase and Fis domain
MERGGEKVLAHQEGGAQNIIGPHTDPCLIGQSKLFQRLLAVADAVARNDCVVLLEGESGTGKELIAKRIHRQSGRSGGPFIPVNCPAVTETLFESQFYGHVKGSFTGAAGDSMGIVRAADDGTLFLDEIGELPLHLQPKLLRLLQEKEVTPVGGTDPVAVNVRFIAATNRSLSRAVCERKFRLDLYHRLNVVRLFVPPLRQRPEDIELLLDYYLDYFAAEYGMDRREMDKSLRESLMSYDWPGNVRELCCWVERLYAADLPAVPPSPQMWDDHYPGTQPLDWPTETNDAFFPVGPDQTNSVPSLEDAEIHAIRKALATADNNRSAAAKLLNIHRSTLLRKIKQYGLS